MTWPFFDFASPTWTKPFCELYFSILILLFFRRHRHCRCPVERRERERQKKRCCCARQQLGPDGGRCFLRGTNKAWHDRNIWLPLFFFLLSFGPQKWYRPQDENERQNDTNWRQPTENLFFFDQQPTEKWCCSHKKDENRNFVNRRTSSPHHRRVCLF